MSAITAGLSTLGVRMSYGVETTAGKKPESFLPLDRVNSIGGITLTPERIDASALEDYASRYVAGRSDTGGDWAVTFNFTDEVETELLAMIAAYKALTEGKRVWYQVSHPSMDKAFFIVAQPPELLPMPEMGQNALLTIEVGFTIEEYKGRDAKVAITE